MTCIATDGKRMAADSRMCTGQMIVSDEMEKMFHAPDGSVVGISGDMGALPLLKKWFEEGCDLDSYPSVKRQDPDEPAFDALVLRPDGTVEFLGETFTFTRYAVPAAIGSGSELAIAAMMCGRSPKEAVELAAVKVTTVGGRIHDLLPKRP